MQFTEIDLQDLRYVKKGILLIKMANIVQFYRCSRGYRVQLGHDGVIYLLCFQLNCNSIR